MLKLLARIFFVCSLFIGIGFTIMGITDYSSKPEDDKGAFLFAVVILGIFPLATGIYGLFIRKSAKKKEEELPQVKIMRLASTHAGKVTIPEVALLLGVRHKQAEEMLEKMRMDGAFELEIVAETGAIIYNLTNYATPDQKENATGILD